MEFKPFPKIARWSRDIVITEKIDGTNASIHIGEDGSFLTASRTRYITPENDNFGFSRWAHGHKDELMNLGPGSHFGEWWGQGIQRGYGLTEKRFSLFNVGRWNEDNKPSCCHVVPVLYSGPMESFTEGMEEDTIGQVMWYLEHDGSKAAPGFMNPEGIIIYHTAANIMFKKTIKDDKKPKSEVK